jgi:hypothetical protein
MCKGICLLAFVEEPLAMWICQNAWLNKQPLSCIAYLKWARERTYVLFQNLERVLSLSCLAVRTLTIGPGNVRSL